MAGGVGDCDVRIKVDSDRTVKRLADLQKKMGSLGGIRWQRTREFFSLIGDVSRPLIAAAIIAACVVGWRAGTRFFQLEKVRDDLAHTNMLFDQAKSGMHVLEGKLAEANRAHSRAVSRLKAGCPFLAPDSE